ncbi:LysM peptidoglycan-binding domain-containing protein [Flammeovirgaceae bacterium SG7u.111]|nr:LysM peptidoglycan-binding domain-containing protein [Flammeovirgaceae bacterium SG7u.132]WPO35489.1 LysM peptidoglycan-binding domain-containing protein [Flammeovirgaceae bacterium SG7u.111]
MYYHNLNAFKRIFSLSSFNPTKIHQRLAYVLFFIIALTISSSSYSANTNAVSTSYHLVKKGETLFAISRKYKVTVSKIQQLNKIKGSNIYAGQRLKVNEIYRPVTSRNNSKSYSSSKRFVTTIAYENYRFILQVKLNRQKLGMRSTYNKKHDITYEGAKLASVEDNIRSRHTVHADGIRYYGQERAHRNFIYKYAGYDMKVAKALAFASSNEGSFDALNFYDGSGSIGFIQFNAKYGALGYLLAWTKEHQPFLFRKYFQEFGIDVEYYRHNSYTYSSINMVVVDPNLTTGKLKLKNNDAVTYLRKHKELSGIFVRAFRNENLKACQVQSAVQMFVKPIQNSKLIIGNYSYRAGTVLNSDAGTAALVDLSVKLGSDGAKKLLEKAIKLHLASNGKGYNLAAYIHDRDIVKAIIRASYDPVVQKRMQKLLSSSLSFS